MKDWLWLYFTGIILGIYAFLIITLRILKRYREKKLENCPMWIRTNIPKWNTGNKKKDKYKKWNLK